MSQRPATVLDPAKIELLRKSLMVAPMGLPLTGLSMFPAIRPGDRSRVVAVDPEGVRVGDILLATRDARLYAHRVVEIRPGPPKQWVLKGDTLLIPDPPFDREAILGQVIGVDRRGRFVDFRSPGGRLAGRAMAALSAPYSRAFAGATVFRRRALAKMADLPAWRARRKSSETERTNVRVAGEDDLDGLAMLFGEQQALRSPMDRIDMEDLRRHARAMWDGADAVGATLWVAERDGLVAAHAVIGPVDGAPGWWVMSVYVKMSLRGAGLAERLVCAGLEDARARGVAEVRYAAYRNNTPSLRLARKLGFAPDDGQEARAFIARYGVNEARAEPLVVLKISL